MTEEFEFIINTNRDLEKLNECKILITGVTGTIGSYLLSFLRHYNKKKNAGLQIICPVRDVAKAIAIHGECKDVEWIDYDKISNFNNRINYVIHCAGPTRSAFFVESPVDTIDAIFSDTHKYLEFFHKFGDRGFLYVSTIEVYGENTDRNKIFFESTLGAIDSLKVRSSYPEGKRLTENLCMAYAKQYNMPIKIVRLSQVLGNSIGDNRLIAYLCDSAKNKDRIILKSDGKAVKSYCYIADCVSAMLTVLVRGDNTAYNIANKAIVASVLQMAEYVSKKYIGEEPIVENGVNDMYPTSSYLVMDTSKVEDLGWKAYFDMGESFKRLIKG